MAACCPKLRTSNLIPSLQLQPSQHLITEEDVDPADRALANRDANEALQEVHAQDTADVADQIGRCEREEAPADDDRQLVRLKDGGESRDRLRVAALEDLVDADRLRKPVDAG